MELAQEGSKLIRVGGNSALLVQRLRAPLEQALEDRRRSYLVHIESIGCLGETLVSITSARGRLPLLFDREDLDPGYVGRVVSDTVARFGL